MYSAMVHERIAQEAAIPPAEYFRSGISQTEFRESVAKIVESLGRRFARSYLRRGPLSVDDCTAVADELERRNLIRREVTVSEQGREISYHLIQ